MGIGGWHCRAQVGGTDGHRWVALMGTGGWAMISKILGVKFAVCNFKA
ncbi:unnamed protein product [Staurois parvus]|uniref:Uncharacterized protein n=1 Tax=Staurois parvus TaxID=386267 RepID=A0ABN9HLF9_9NEOB|nr:unnamed protein product [Staurois parvus]